ncbi:MAG: Fic family protein [Bacteroidota bacterium]|jgi:hypothetical protein
MAFDPITWALGFGATQGAKSLIDRLYNEDLRSKLTKAAEKWSDSLPDDIRISPAVLLDLDDNGQFREELQLCLFLHNKVPDELLWYQALAEVWNMKKDRLGNEAHAFILQDKDLADTYLKDLASRLTLVCMKDRELFSVSAIHELNALRKQSIAVHETMSLVLDRLEKIDLPVRPPNHSDAGRQLDNALIVDYWGLMELNRIVQIDRQSESVSGKLRTCQSWVGVKGTTMEEAVYLPPPPNEVDSLYYKFVERWSPSGSSLLQIESLEDAAKKLASFHYDLVAIHPFEDGNGRVARVMTDKQVCQLHLKFEPLCLKSDVRYMQTLIDANKGDMDPLSGLILEKIKARGH